MSTIEEYWANKVKVAKTTKSNLQDELEYLEEKVQWILDNCCPSPTADFVVDNSDNAVISNSGDSIIV